MEFSWAILLAVVVCNTIYMAFMYLLQVLDESLPPRWIYIPGTNQKFLHVQDFYTTTVGDFFAIPFIANAFVHLVASDVIDYWQWLIFIAIVVADALGFLMMCLGKNHKPDQGYPDIGKVSWHGLSHLPYHGACVAMAVLGIWHAIIGNLRGPVLYAALLGAMLYIASFVADIKSGNFDQLKKV